MALPKSLSSPLNVWYLDDGTLGGTTEEVIDDFNTILCCSPLLGFELNVNSLYWEMSHLRQTIHSPNLEQWLPVFIIRQRCFWGSPHLRRLPYLLQAKTVRGAYDITVTQASSPQRALPIV